MSDQIKKEAIKINNCMSCIQVFPETSADIELLYVQARGGKITKFCTTRHPGSDWYLQNKKGRNRPRIWNPQYRPNSKVDGKK